MSNEIIMQCFLAFFSQLAFLWARTINVHATATLNVRETMISGVLINFFWLIGIGIGSNSAFKLMVEYDLTHLPVVLCISSGSLLGAYIGIKNKIKQVNKKNEKTN